MKIVVIGGSGFLGSHVADKLSQAGHEVTIFDLKKSQWISKNQTMVIGDILKISDLDKVISESDVVYNFAAISDIDEAENKPQTTANINIIGTLNILELCKKYKVKRIMFASTIYVYSQDGNFYRCSKQAAESFIEEYETYIFKSKKKESNAKDKVSKIESPIPWNSFRNQIPKEAADSLENISSFLNPEKEDQINNFQYN